MQHITGLLPFDNVGGMYFFRFVPSIDVESIPAPIGLELPSEVVLKSGKQWYNGYFPEEECELNIDAAYTSNGPLYKFNLDCIVPRISKLMTTNFNEMLGHRFLLDVYDNNGNRKLVGDIKEGVAFKFKEATGRKAANRNGYQIMFFSESTIILNNYPDNGAITTPGGDPGGS